MIRIPIQEVGVDFCGYFCWQRCMKILEEIQLKSFNSTHAQSCTAVVSALYVDSTAQSSHRREITILNLLFSEQSNMMSSFPAY